MNIPPVLPTIAAPVLPGAPVIPRNAARQPTVPPAGDRSGASPRQKEA